jgi:Zn-dependent protease with chaperone function
MAAFDMNTIAQASALRLVDCLVEGTLIAGFAAVVLRVVGRQSSAARFAVWFTALVAIAVLPLLGAGALAGILAPQSWAVSAGLPGRAVVTLPESWSLYLFAAWGVIAGWLIIRVGRGLWHLHVLRESCVAVDPALLDARLRETLAGARTTRPVEFCTSDRVNVPTAIGLVKPAVVVPEWVMRELSAEELNQILLHEVAHLRRWDDWTNLAQQLVKALFFFHPAVWWVERQVSLEREMACDDAVVEATASPRAYAECLAHLAEKTLVRRSVALAQAALGRIRQTSLRVAQILDVNRSANRPLGGGRSWKTAVGLVGAFALVCLVGVSRAPRLVAFSDDVARPTMDRAVGSSTATAVTDFGINPASMAIPIVKASASETRADECVRRHVCPVSTVRSESRGVRFVQAKLSSGVAHRGQNFVRAAAMRPNASIAHASIAHAAIVHAAIVPASLRRSEVGSGMPAAIPVAFTETIFVVVKGNEDGSADRAAIQIQMWRVVVLHPVVNPDNRIPAKQT